MCLPLTCERQLSRFQILNKGVLCGGFYLDLYPTQFESYCREQSQPPETMMCLASHETIKLPFKAGVQSELLLEMTKKLFSVTFCCQRLVFQCSRGPLKLMWTSPQPVSPHPFSGHQSGHPSVHRAAMDIPSLGAVLAKTFSVYVSQDFFLLSSFSILGINLLADVSFEMMYPSQCPCCLSL